MMAYELVKPEAERDLEYAVRWYDDQRSGLGGSFWNASNPRSIAFAGILTSMRSPIDLQGWRWFTGFHS